MRYEYPEDRKEFWRWVEAPGPCRRPYFRYDHNDRDLIIEIGMRDAVVRYRIAHIHLANAMAGWRILVADSVRYARRELANHFRAQAGVKS